MLENQDNPNTPEEPKEVIKTTPLYLMENGTFCEYAIPEFAFLFRGREVQDTLDIGEYVPPKIS